jgi:hypothetical protein
MLRSISSYVGPLELAICLLATAMSTVGCGSLSPPFDKMKSSQMTVYRLQNFEPAAQPQAQATPNAWQIPPVLQQWIQAGASLLPPGLLPPGLVPGTAPAVPTAADAPRFHGFRVLDYQPVEDPGLKGDIVDVFGTKGNFQNATSSCMFAEFGFAIAQPNAPTPADILVSLSCEHVQSYNFMWPYAQDGLTPDASKKIVAIALRVFQGR